MAGGRATVRFGSRVYGVGVMVLGGCGLVLRNFIAGQPVPRGLHDRAALAYATAALMLGAGAAIQWRRTAAWGAAMLAAYYGFVVVLLMHGRVLLRHYAEYGAYEDVAEQVAIAAGALIVFAAGARLRAAAGLTRAGQVAFGVCALLFGGAHFVYMNLTAPLVPRWLPPSQHFWADATGVGFLAAGVAILALVQARAAAILLTVMLASFTLLVHVPLIAAHPASIDQWSELGVNLAVMGAAWVVADSLQGARR